MKITLEVDGERWNLIRQHGFGPNAYYAVHDDYDIDDDRCLYGDSIGEVVQMVVDYELEKQEETA